MGIGAEVTRGCIRIGSLAFCMGFCSLLLYRYFPSLFTFLVSSWPIVFCTAVLIMALLSFRPSVSKAKEENQNHAQSVAAKCTKNGGSVAEKATTIINQKVKEEMGLSKVNEGNNEEEINGEKRVIKVKERDTRDNIEGHSVEVDSYNQPSALDSDADSSSPDASVTDVMPTLDEIHPLIESEPPVATVTTCDESDGQESDGTNVNLAEDNENVEGEEAQEKDVVTWSADDEKSLKNLGTLEIERNRRLENLIAKRIARKRWMFEAQKNLIDLDGNGMQITIPARRNPFDPHYDFDAPDSAPPGLLPRLNPFDPPFEEEPQEKANPVAENSSHHRESDAVRQREMFFRRYESFGMGPSFLGGMNQKKHDFKPRPYFVAEGSADDPTSQRQFGKMNDPMMNSIPEASTVTASVSSASADHGNDEKEPVGQEWHQVNELESETNERDSEFTEDSDSVLSDSNPSDVNEEISQDLEAYERQKVKSIGEKKGAHNDRVEQLFYDSSPSARERGIPHDDRESISNSEYERQDIESDDEELWMAPPRLCEVDENESRSSRGIKLVNERDVIHVGMIPEPIPEDDLQNISSSSPMVKELGPQNDTAEKTDAEGNHKEFQDLSSQNKNQ